MEPKVNCTWNNQEDFGQTIHDQFGDDCQSWLCCFCMQPPPSVYKSSCPLIVSCGESAFGQMSIVLTPPSPPFVVYSRSVWLFVTPWTVACQTPLSMGFSRQEYWGGLLFPSARDLLEAGIEPTHPALMGGFWADSLPLSHHGNPLPPSPPPFLASKIRQTFLSINMTSSMAFEREAARP